MFKRLWLALSIALFPITAYAGGDVPVPEVYDEEYNVPEYQGYEYGDPYAHTYPNYYAPLFDYWYSGAHEWNTRAYRYGWYGWNGYRHYGGDDRWNNHWRHSDYNKWKKGWKKRHKDWD